MKKSLLALMTMVGVSSLLAGENLIKDGDVNRTPLSPEFRLGGVVREGRISQEVEDRTWDKSVKFEIAEIGCYGGDRNVPHVSVKLFIGGNEKSVGFPCKPKTEYRFSFVAKGDAERVFVDGREWEGDAQGDGKGLQSSVNVFAAQREWMRYAGTFKTGPNAARAALVLGYWGRGTDFHERVGQYVLVDKIVVEEVARGVVTGGGAVQKPAGGLDALDEAAVCVVPDQGGRKVSLRPLRNALTDEPAHYPSMIAAYADEAALHFGCRFSGKPAASYSGVGGKGIWDDDIVEFFFEPENPAEETIHLVVSAGGGRWMSGKGAGTWTAKATVAEDGWSVRVDVPWRAMGFSGKPPSDRPVRFNVARTHVVGPKVGDGIVDTKRGTRNNATKLLDDTTFSFTRGKYVDRSRWGVLFIGSMRPYADRTLAALTEPETKAAATELAFDRPGLLWSQLEELKRRDREIRLSKKRIIIARVKPDTETATPFLPEELNDANGKLKLRAAINERAMLPVAVANMTGEMEEFHVWLSTGRYTPQHEFGQRPYPERGLVAADGARLDERHFTLRRGVKYRDADAANHGRRYDPLVKLDDIGAVPVPSKEAGLVWIEFDCRGVKPGVYRGKLAATPMSGGRMTSIKYNKDNSFSVTDDTEFADVELEVLPFALPEPPAMALVPCNAGFTDSQLALMNDIGVSTHFISPWYFESVYNADGTVQKRMNCAWMPELLRRLARDVPRVNGIPRFFVCYSVYSVFKRACWPHKDKVLSEDYWAAYRDWVRHIDATLAENGVMRDDYTVEVLDEPFDCNWNHAEIVRAFKETKAAVKGLKITSVNGDQDFYEDIKSVADDWVFAAGTYIDPKTRGKIKAFRAQPGRTIALYLCRTSMREPLYRYYRLLPWTSAAAGGNRCVIYELYDGEPGISLRRATQGGLIYDNGQTVIPSIRLMNLWIGMTDVRYLKLLESVAGKAGDAPKAKAALAFVEKAFDDAALVNPHDNTRAETLREKAIELILGLMK